MSLFERIADAFREPGARAETAAEGSVSDDPDADADPDGDAGSGDDEADPNELTDAVVAVCQRAPEGIRTYTIEITAEGGEITEVAPGLLEAHFEVVDGGVGEDAVTVRAVDFRGEARTVDAETLVGVRLAEPVPLADVQMRLLSAEDHDGDTLPSEWFRIAAVE
ncbi:hypothetical protein [Halobaculum marinum]|uniref:Uncharacterized protein n=1 Tax=Halobaculum marinum TaxID=3031996 RepID=A0ABD5WRM7_9EURY|nr:hypothetical protein [Halobaculum sp. DT55]